MLRQGEDGAYALFRHTRGERVTRRRSTVMSPIQKLGCGGRRLLVGTMLVAACAVPVPAAEFRSERHGYSLTLPESWELVTEENRDEFVWDIGDEVPELETISFEKVDMYAIAEGPDGSIAVAAVRPTRGRITVGKGKGDTKHYEKAIRGQRDAKISDLTIEETTVASEKSFSGHWMYDGPDYSHPQRQWQLVVPGIRCTVFLIFSARASNFERFEPEFRAIVNSLDTGATQSGLSLKTGGLFLGLCAIVFGGLTVYFRGEGLRAWIESLCRRAG